MLWEELKSESTADLVELVKSKEQPDYKELAEAAFVELTFRFRKEVIHKCRVVARNWQLNSAIADQIAEQTFDRFWKYPFSFQKEKCKTLDINKCVKLYLFRIASNLVIDYVNKANGNGSPYDESEEIVVEFPELDSMELPEEKAKEYKQVCEKITAALDRLSPKHRIIYLTYKVHEKEGFKLPRKLLSKLRDELDLTQSSIRVYKKEAFEKIEEYLKIYGSK